jgi:serine/threonine-protein kinase
MDIEQLAGTKLGNYKIESLLGRGGMGVVYKARQISLNRSVALKILSPDLSSDSSFVKRFKREAQAIAQLDHPNIVQIFDTAKAKSLHFFSMQYIEGNNFAEVLKEKGRLDATEAVRIIAQAAQGIEHAHRNGIIHRDIKPSNIILDESGNAKVMDFGLARSTEERSKLTQSGTLIGTLDYMSPEQCRGEEADGRTDIYSLGVVLYEALAGRTPFEAPNEAALINKIVNEDMPVIQTLNPDVPISLSKIILKALAKDKEIRYSEIGELLEDLRSCAEALKPAKATTPLAIDMPSASNRDQRIGVAVIAAVLVCLCIGGILLLREPKEPAPPTAEVAEEKTYSSIAVLPFVNMSADPDQEYFCDGMSEELINALAQIRDLRVIARTSAFSFKDQNIDIREIAEQLGVETILEGSVRKSGSRLRITAQLVDVSTNDHLWSERYDKEAKDIFAIQDEITLAIVDNLKIELLGDKGHTLAKRQAIDPEVYDLYLRGRHLIWERNTDKDLNKAIEYFKQVLELAPNYAPAYADMAAAYHGLHVGRSLPAGETAPKARAAALRALELDKNLSQPHVSLAWDEMCYKFNWERAEKEFKLAIKLNPRDAVARHFYALYLTYLGRFDEAIDEMRRGLEIDPLSPMINTGLGTVFFHARDYDKAIDSAEAAIELDPSFHLAHQTLAHAYHGKGLYEKALVEYQRTAELRGDEIDYDDTGSIYADMGKMNEARDMRDSFLELPNIAEISPYPIAALHFALGEEVRGFDWLEKAYREQDWLLVSINVDPAFDSVRSDPRYISLLKKMNLELPSPPKKDSRKSEEQTYSSIAVLPFADMSPGKDQEYFCDGMSEELINALTQLKDLRVIARTSAFQFKGKDIDIREIGKLLTVDAILEGSVRKAGNRVRITAQLVDTRGGHHLWSDKYDRELEDIFAIQDEITVAIVERLKPKLLSAAQAKPAIQRTDNPEAHDLCLKGQYFAMKRTPDDLDKAIKYFEKAIEKDPSFALPYVELANSYVQLQYVSLARPNEVNPKATRLVLKALEIDDTLSEAHSQLGWIKSTYEWDWAGGERELKRALELNPGDSDAFLTYALLLSFMGRFEEAIDAAKRGLELDPLYPLMNQTFVEVLANSNRHEEAMEHQQRLIEMYPDFPYMRMNLGNAYLSQSMFEEALSEFQKQKDVSLSPIIDAQADTWIGIIYTFMGETEKAKGILVDLEERSIEMYVPPVYIAQLYYVLGDHDIAYEWLDRAYKEHDFWLCYLKIFQNAEMVDPNPRSDPRYQAILKKIGLDK